MEWALLISPINDTRLSRNEVPTLRWWFVVKSFLLLFLEWIDWWSWYIQGESGVGKTTFVNTLFTTTIKDPKQLAKRHSKQIDKTVEIEITKAELEEKNFKVKLTIIDTPGFGDYVNNRHSWIPIVDFIDDQHEKYMRQEQQPCREGVVDMRVHACLYFIKPTGHT